ncbi:hypothetical protein ACIQH5_04965 [Paenarthrobacter sp. NPDC091711]|uniref:hypothetical protein n=1 Tax=Paenarthrobacter sp. NPDC091711 TaxID=3364385 RepID=UPI003815ED63
MLNDLADAFKHHGGLNTVTAADHSLAPAAGSGDGVEPVALCGLIIDGLFQGRKVARRRWGTLRRRSA